MSADKGQMEICQIISKANKTKTKQSRNQNAFDIFFHLKTKSWKQTKQPESKIPSKVWKQPENQTRCPDRNVPKAIHTSKIEHLLWKETKPLKWYLPNRILKQPARNKQMYHQPHGGEMRIAPGGSVPVPHLYEGGFSSESGLFSQPHFGFFFFF